MLPRKEFLKSIARKRIGGGVVFLNRKNQILLVKASYKDNWLLPGGIVDKNESPKEAAAREAQEEIGIKVRKLKLVSVFWGIDKEYDDDYLTFDFYGGVIKKEEDVKIDGDEIIDFRFVSINKLEKFVSPGTKTRIDVSLANCDFASTIYNEAKLKSTK